MTYTNNHYNKKLKGFARSNRKKSTLSEKTLWLNLLKSRGLMGYQFLRQRPIDKYVVDFFSKDLNLIIELDGLTHGGREKEDLERQTNLETLGYNMIRFDDTEVVEDFSVVREILCRWIENFELAHPEVLKFKKRHKRSSPWPPSKGEQNMVIPLTPFKGGTEYGHPPNPTSASSVQVLRKGNKK